MGLTNDNWTWYCLKELKSSCLRCYALASNKLQAIPLASSFTLWTVVSIAEGLETFAERFRGTVQPHGLEVQGSNSEIHFNSSKKNLAIPLISVYTWLHQPPFPALHVFLFIFFEGGGGGRFHTLPSLAN